MPISFAVMEQPALFDWAGEPACTPHRPARPSAAHHAPATTLDRLDFTAPTNPVPPSIAARHRAMFPPLARTTTRTALAAPVQAPLDTEPPQQPTRPVRHLLAPPPAPRPQRPSDVHLPAPLLALLDTIPTDNPWHPADPIDWTAPRPSHDEAVCASIGVSPFFPDPISDIAPAPSPEQAARSACAACPVQTECMTWALRNETYGLWGLTAPERHALGGRAPKSRVRDQYRAARTALAAGIDPDALIDALTAVRDMAQQPPTSTDQLDVSVLLDRLAQHTPPTGALATNRLH